MSVKPEELLAIKGIKLYGLNKEEPFYKEDGYDSYYYQKLFVRGEINENFDNIRICNKDDSLNPKEENDDFVISMLCLAPVGIPNYDKTDEDDSETFIFHGVDAKALIFCGKIVAIGNSDEMTWVNVENFFIRRDRQEINSLKKELVKKKIKEYDRDIKCYLCSRKFDVEKYNEDLNYINSLHSLLASLENDVA